MAAGDVKRPTDVTLLQAVERLLCSFPVAAAHREALEVLGSQIVYASRCHLTTFDTTWLVLVRFSSQIETAFGLTREVLAIYSPHTDLQLRTHKAIREMMDSLPRSPTPDLVLLWSPDPRTAVKVDDWNTPHLTVVPLPVIGESKRDMARVLLAALRERIYSRDLYYETGPVSGERFFGRRKLLASLADDLLSRRVAGVFGLRKAGKTSVLRQIAMMISERREQYVFLLRDLESLPGPPNDPVPYLLRDLQEELLLRLREQKLRTHELVQLGNTFDLAAFRRAFQAVLRKESSTLFILALDEVEYLMPLAPSSSQEEFPSIPQLFGMLRSLVQENENFTFVLSGLTSAIIEVGRLYGRPNPLFSWAKLYFVGPFAPNEGRELLTTLGERMGVRWTDDAMSELLEQTSGHPYLFRNLASVVVQSLPIAVERRVIERYHVTQAIPAWRREVAGNFREILDHVRENYPEEAFLLDLLLESPSDFYELIDEEPLAVNHLLKLGLVDEVGEGRFRPSRVVNFLPRRKQ